jgi:CheY-like chemotaxis protein
VVDGLHVIVVDDNEDAREIMRETLKCAGALVTVCETADEAATRPRLPPASRRGRGHRHAVAKWTRPGRAIRALPAGKGGSIPAVAVTAFGARFPRSVAISAGFQEYLLKPLDMWELSRLVAKAAGLTR